MACASASPCVLARARAVAPRNAASRGTEPSSSGARGASPRSLGDRRAPWARAASGGVDVSLSSTLPALKPWAEAKVQKCAGAWEKAAALAPNPPIAVVDLVPDAAAHFPAPGPVPDEPPWFEDAWGRRDAEDSPIC